MCLSAACPDLYALMHQLDPTEYDISKNSTRNDDIFPLCSLCFPPLSVSCTINQGSLSLGMHLVIVMTKTGHTILKVSQQRQVTLHFDTIMTNSGHTILNLSRQRQLTPSCCDVCRQAEAEKREKARQENLVREANRRATAERQHQVQLMFSSAVMCSL